MVLGGFPLTRTAAWRIGDKKNFLVTWHPMLRSGSGRVEDGPSGPLPRGMGVPSPRSWLDDDDRHARG